MCSPMVTMRLKLRTKLALGYALVFVILLGASGIGIFELLALRLTADADDNLLDHLAGLWGYVHFVQGKPALDYDLNNDYLGYFLRETTRYYQIYDGSTGQLLLESEDSRLMQLALPPDQASKAAIHPGIDKLPRGGAPLRFRSAVFRAEGHAYLVRVGVSVEHDLEDLAELRRVLLWILPLATAMAVLGAWWMAGRGLRPLRDLEGEAAAISITQLSRRLPQRGSNDELDSLAGAFNEVLSRLDASVRQMRDFAEFMAHELRTPMTVLRGEVEVELMRYDLPAEWRSHLESHLEEYEKLNRLINRFLLLAKAETGAVNLNKREMSLSELGRALIDLLKPVGESIGIQLSFEGDEEVTAVADREWMERALSNLLDNALKFTPAQGHIYLSVRNETGGAVIEIADTGQGIPLEDQPHIFERFYRGERSDAKDRSPGGLGLSLTRWIIEQHEGSISMQSTPGKGTTFSIILPRSRHAAVADPEPSRTARVI